MRDRDAARRGRPVGHDRVPPRPLHGLRGRHRGRPIRDSSPQLLIRPAPSPATLERRSGHRKRRPPSPTAPPSSSMPASRTRRSRWSRSSRASSKTSPMSPKSPALVFYGRAIGLEDRRRPAPRHPRAGRLGLRRERDRAARPAEGTVHGLHRQEAPRCGMAAGYLARPLLGDPERRRGRVPRGGTGMPE